MIVSFLLGLAALAPATEDLTIRVPVEPRRSIMPAITVYIECLHQTQARLSQGVGRLRADRMRRVVEQARAECAPVWVEARAHALSIMNSDQMGPPSDPEGEIERMLAAVQASEEGALRTLARAEQAESPKR